MPIRVKLKPQPVREGSPFSARYDAVELPYIGPDDSFRLVVKKLSQYFTDAVELPSTFEQLRTTSAGDCLRLLVNHLTDTCANPAIVNALLALKWHYALDRDNQGLGEARSNACEIVAWRFLTRHSEREAVTFCLYEIPDRKKTKAQQQQQLANDPEAGERAPLLPRVLATFDGSSPSAPVGSSSKKIQLLSSLSRLTNLSFDDDDDDDEEDDPTAAFEGLNALEIAAVANAKRFLSQHVVQKIISGIWNGDIVFWDTMAVNSSKHPHFYNPTTSDPYSRLRVPKYLKCWEVLFFGVFLCLYYSVLIVRDETRLTGPEIALFFWIAAFFYDELSEWADAGAIFYATDIWNLFDMIMILIGIIFAVLRIIGILQPETRCNDLAFDVLALEALFMIPRICSILSLSPYWGTLIPCLKEMGKDFIKFMVLIIIVYLGFLTTFSLVGRDSFSLSKMTGILTKIFYGSSYVGFEVMDQIDPIFGPPLMVIFITLSSFLLMGSLTGMLSNSFSRVVTHAKEEYLYVYSVYVLEASTSNRLTHFYPPFNLLSLVLFRPWRYIFPRYHKYRAGRIWLLKVTHAPIVAVIKFYEWLKYKGDDDDEFRGFKGPKEPKGRRRRSDIGPGAVTGRPALSSPRRSGAARLLPTSRMRGEDDVDAPSSVEVQVMELQQKIDQLTAVVLAMRESQIVNDENETAADGNNVGSL
ncbi:conserved hypothetical protein [Trichoderma atroviride IMI 206040]|uniref:Calcium channel YVC1-like C-terminal transmembrane domain-containing protein n=1 Tax=Hypocrea atroviridis (strain ATCC 20476 / IMI 206040) TaxID=452589 RepID=G9NG37_HYPAI|nr:uncharacterized protein TRIATDRAFT_90550 [Trichoderma atroviride IMI 206040]EHK50249.1 conserved hypothetical protein [Trichoderma atroviride IMI 206040]